MPTSRGLLAMLWLGQSACWPFYKGSLPSHASKPEEPASVWLVSALYEDAAGEFGRGVVKAKNTFSLRPISSEIQAKRQAESTCTPMHQMQHWATCANVSAIAVATFSPHAPWVYGHVYPDTLHVLYNMLMRTLNVSHYTTSNSPRPFPVPSLI
ncbi:hypothetical protein T492DRAFT_284844 [Pavlovales sp. CCMP2436]|nr:hypothetical protein T492DRAFT_284844 [Pavlovales sp. CCMP2436]